MWTWLKYFAAEKNFADDIAELDMLGGLMGYDNAINYRRLRDDFPEVERGHNEDIDSHYNRLQKAFNDWRNEDTSIVDRRKSQQESGKAVAPGSFSEEPERKPERPAPPHSESTGRGHQIELWPDELPSRVPQSSGINTTYEPRSSLPTRDPGRALIDQMFQAGRPLPQRTPGQFVPRPQTMDEWLQSMRDKGIKLGPDNKRIDAITDLPRRKPMPPRGRDIWGDLIYPERDGVIRAAAHSRPMRPETVNQWIMDKLAYHDNRDELGRFAPKEYRRPTIKTDKPGAYHHALREFGGDQAKALAWDRLRREHPDEPIGPDESYQEHFTRLKKKYQSGEPPKRQHNKIKPHVEKRKSSAVANEFIMRALAGVRYG